MPNNNTSGRSPTKEDWDGLYRAAIRFKESSPWAWMENEDLFAVEDPLGGETGYCSILGNGGQEFGLVLFIGTRGYEAYERLIMDGEAAASLETGFDTCSVSAIFVARNHLTKTDIDVIRSLGLSFRGRNAWPLFRSQRPGYLPWLLDQEEALFLTSALRQALNVATRVRDGSLDLFDGCDDDLILTRCFHEGEWLDEWRKPKVEEEVVAPPVRIDKERLQRIRARAGKRSGSWELDFFILPMAIESETGRPYFPNCILAVERNQGLIVGTELLVPSLPAEERREAVIRLMEKAASIPQEILVKDKEMRRLIEPLALDLGVSVRVARLHFLEEARRSLYEHVGRRSPGSG